MDCTSAADLPDEIVLHILSRTSIETLARCRLISKEIKQITYDPSFRQHFFQRKKLELGFFIQPICSFKFEPTFISMSSTNPDSQLSVGFLPDPHYTRLVTTTKAGIILLCNDVYAHYYVCKPTTKQWEKIPDPKTNLYDKAIYAMAVLRSTPLHYKIVRLVFDHSKSRSSIECEIFDSERWKWIKPLMMNPINLPPELFLSNFKNVVWACGIFYILLSNNEIFGFDLENERWGILSLPLPILLACGKNINDVRGELVEYEGRLAFICIRQEYCLELWVVERNGREKYWSKKHKVCIEALIRNRRNVYPLNLWNYDAAIIFDEVNFELIFYKFQERSFNVVKLENHLNISDHRIDLFHLEADYEPMIVVEKPDSMTQVGPYN